MKRSDKMEDSRILFEKQVKMSVSVEVISSISFSQKKKSLVVLQTVSEKDWVSLSGIYFFFFTYFVVLKLKR